MTAELLETLKSKVARPPTQSCDKPVDDLEQAIQHLVIALDIYLTTSS
jgi:hypothetical protein